VNWPVTVLFDQKEALRFKLFPRRPRNVAILTSEGGHIQASQKPSNF
jgi:hypothetical protein